MAEGQKSLPGVGWINIVILHCRTIPASIFKTPPGVGRYFSLQGHSSRVRVDLSVLVRRSAGNRLPAIFARTNGAGAGYRCSCPWRSVAIERSEQAKEDSTHEEVCSLADCRTAVHSAAYCCDYCRSSEG